MHYYALDFSSIDEANEFIELINNRGFEWRPVHLSDSDSPTLRFECSKRVYRGIRAIYENEI